MVRHHVAAAIPVHRVRHVLHRVRPGPVRPVRIAAAEGAPAPAQRYAESSFAQRTIPVYVLRPTSCDTAPPAALQSAPPAAFVPPAQKLLDELAGPDTRLAAGPAGIAPGDTGAPSVGGGPLTIGGLPGIAGGLPGGTQGVGPLPVEGPPVEVPPVLGPPVLGPPVTGPPVVGQPPIVILPPVDVPPLGGGPPPVAPPVVGQPPTSPAPSAVPEPETWSMLMLGALAVGGVLRSGRSRARRGGAT